MCFSAGASFAAGAVISATGGATMLKARQPDRLLFAAIPFIFGAQQLVVSNQLSVISYQLSVVSFTMKWIPGFRRG